MEVHRQFCNNQISLGFHQRDEIFLWFLTTVSGFLFFSSNFCRDAEGN